MRNDDPDRPAIPAGTQSSTALIGVRCTNCGHEYRIQANFREPQPLEENAVEFPPDNVLVCAKCGNKSDVTPLRRELEKKADAEIV